MLMIFSVMILMLIVTLLVSPTLFTNYGLIKEFPDSQQIFVDEGTYQVTDRKLINNERDKVVFPNDELTYSFKVHNLKNFNTILDYQIEFFKGGVLEEPTYSNHGNLDPLSEEIQVTRKIYLKSSGSYDVKLNLFFKNSTDEKYAQYSPPMDNIETLSRSEQLQDDANQLTFKGLIAASVIGLGSIIALGFSVYYSHKHVKQSKIQFQTEKRAWLGATTMMQYDHVTKILEFPYKNYGKLPAQNIREYHGFVIGDSFSRKDIPKTRKEINHTATVFPDQEANYNIGGLPVKVTSMIENKERGLFIWIEIDYEYSGTIGLYGVIFELQPLTGHYLVIDEWMK